MYEDIIEKIQIERWEEARLLLLQVSQTDDISCILNATVDFHFGEWESMFKWLEKGIRCNPDNAELYLLLGNYYEEKNVNQAYLCYEMALSLCKEQKDYDTIMAYLNNLSESFRVDVKPYSYIIISYNSLKKTKDCIESIRKNDIEGTYEIIVVDNASSDGSREWLLEYKNESDIKIMCNEENRGFPIACNQGIKMAEPENDIFLLNNDAIVTPKSVFWLRMGLYSDENVGVTGSVSNCAGNHQAVFIEEHTMEKFEEYAFSNNVLMESPYEMKVYLIGFAMMIKRKALDEVGLLDTRFTPGTFEDVDYGVRMNQASWKVMLCKNSFIIHMSKDNENTWYKVYGINKNKFKEKWGMDVSYYSHAREDIIELIQREKNEKFNVLEVGCGMGATLSRISSEWKYATVKGIEISDEVARIGQNITDITIGNIEEMKIDYPQGEFDYIILADVLEHIHNPIAVLEKLKGYLKQDGCFLFSIPNIAHFSVIWPLINGRFDYQNEGLLDRTHVHFFTLESIKGIIQELNMDIKFLAYLKSNDSDKPENLEIVNRLTELTGSPEDKYNFMAYQYILKVGNRK